MDKSLFRSILLHLQLQSRTPAEQMECSINGNRMMNTENVELRKKLIRNCHRIVVKAGTRLLTDPDSLPVLIGQIKTIRDAGKQVILVSSGAVGTGMKILRMKISIIMR